MFVRLENRIIKGTDEDKEAKMIYQNMRLHGIGALRFCTLLNPNEEILTAPSPWGGSLEIINVLPRMIGIVGQLIGENMILYIFDSTGSFDNRSFPGGAKKQITVLPRIFKQKSFFSGEPLRDKLLNYQRNYEIASEAEAIERHRQGFALSIKD